MKSFVAFLMFAVHLCCFAASETNLLSVGEWSKPISDPDGYAIRGRLLLCQVPWRGDHNALDVGVYLELEEVSESGGFPLEVFCDLDSVRKTNGLYCELRHSDGRSVPQGGAFSGGGPAASWFTLPSYSSIRFRVSMFGTAKYKDQGLPIYLTHQQWIIPHGATNDCFLSGTLTVNPPTNHIVPLEHHVWKGALTLPALRIPVKKL